MELTISVVRSGGMAGSRRSWELQLDCEHEADSWQPLLDACPWDAAPGGTDRSVGAPDRFSYRITAGDRSATVPERDLLGPWRELADRVREAAEHRPADPPIERQPAD